MRRGAALAVAAAVAVAAGCVAWRPAEVASAPQADAVTGVAPVAMPAPAVTAAVPSLSARPAGDAPLPASLQGTEVDGAWRADAQGRLVVDRALRRRLDYWLSSVGEWSPEVIGTQMMVAAGRDLPPPAVQALQSLWARYVELQRHAWQRTVLPADPSTWRPALEERQSVRRLLLGQATAQAFFGDEEQQLWRQVLALEAGQTVAAELPPAVPEHPQAAQRVAEVQAEWDRWERRLAQARAEQARLQAAPELSDTQRGQALQAWLGARFDTREQVRVRALLGLGSPG